MYILIEDNDLFGKNKVGACIKKEFDSELVYKNFVLKTKIKSYEAIDFQNKELPKASSNHIYLAVIVIDSALKKEEN